MLFRNTAASAVAMVLAIAPASAFAQSSDTHAHAGHSGHMDMPDDAPSSPWQIHSHTVLTLASDSQEGPRGDNKTFLAGMTMLTATRDFGDRNSLELQAMLSPDPFMGKNGYPLLLQTGETADGVTHLVDRQHPHDLFMGLTAKLTHRFDGQTSAFIQAGYPGEFAFGPTTFMHRPSGEDLPTAPMTHHWFDSGHITMGVLTGGLSHGPLSVEVSQFTGREPDEKRFDLDPVRLDSTSLRLGWVLMPGLKAQASWAHQVSPEALHPDADYDKSSLSLEYIRNVGKGGQWASTLAFGRKQESDGHDKAADAWLFENTWKINDKWSALSRFERVYNDELATRAWWVSRGEIGAMRTFTLSEMASLNLGIVQQFTHLPDGLKADYGDNPGGTVAFMTFKFHAMKM